MPARPAADDAAVHDAAAKGTSGSGGPLPHLAAIQRSFGRHDVSGIKAHTDDAAKQGANAMGAQAFAHGDHVAFGGAPSLHTAAHEAAHVVQQRAGVHLKGGVGQEGDTYEQHADAVADRVVRGESAEGLLDQYAAGGGGAAAVQRSMRSERAAAASDAIYAEKAQAFEIGMGSVIASDPNAIEGANLMLDAVKKIVDAYAKHTGKGKEETYAQEFAWAGGDKYYGAFQMTGEAIKKVFDDKSQPLRKKLKVVYNAVRNNNLGKWLEVAVQELMNKQAGKAAGNIAVHRNDQNTRNPDGSFAKDGWRQDMVTPGFAKDSGLDKVFTGPKLGASNAKLAPHKWDPKDGVDHVVSGADTYSPLISPHAELSKANQDRRGGQNAGIALADQRTLTRGDVSDLTSAEIRQLYKNEGKPVPGMSKSEKNAFKADKKKAIGWEQGGSYFDVIPSSDVDKKAAEIHARLEAGISGSTDLMLHAAQELGLSSPAAMKKIRLAMLGWMLQNRDHSYYEIMKSAENYGLPFTVDPSRRGYEYEAPANFDPMDPKKLKNILPEKQFPSFFASAGEVAKVDRGLANPDRGADEFRTEYEAAGIPRPVLDKLSERDLAELGLLKSAAAAAKFQAGGDARIQKLNHQQVRELQRSAPYLGLVRAHPVHAPGMLMSLIKQAHGAGVLNDTESRLEGSQGQLPAVDTNADGRVRALEAAGVPPSALVGAKEHVISDLVQLMGVVMTARFDTSGGPGSVAANNAETRKLKQTQLYNNAVVGLGPQRADLVLASLCQHKHAGLESTVYALPSDEAEAVVAAGIPATFVAGIHPSWFPVLTQLVDAIGKIVPTPAPQQLPALQALGTTAPFDQVKQLFGAAKFEVMVDTVARNKGITFAAGSEHDTLADLGGFLTPGATKIAPDKRGEFDDAAAARYFPGAGAKAKYDAQTAGARTTMESNLAGHGLDGEKYADLTDAEIWGIQEYTKFGGMGKWQEALATMNAKDKTMFGLGKVNLKIKAALSGLNKITPFAGPVYNGQRGLSGVDPADAAAVQRWINANYPVGAVKLQTNFLSSAKSIGASFIPKPEYPVAWVISNVKTGRDIQAISLNSGEEEVLFPPGAKLVVTKVENKLNDVDPNKKKVWVHLMEV